VEHGWLDRSARVRYVLDPVQGLGPGRSDRMAGLGLYLLPKRPNQWCEGRRGKIFPKIIEASGIDTLHESHGQKNCT
jgi:hypothetical protein